MNKIDWNFNGGVCFYNQTNSNTFFPTKRGIEDEYLLHNLFFQQNRQIYLQTSHNQIQYDREQVTIKNIKSYTFSWCYQGSHLCVCVWGGGKEITLIHGNCLKNSTEIRFVAIIWLQSILFWASLSFHAEWLQNYPIKILSGRYCYWIIFCFQFFPLYSGVLTLIWR